MDRSIPGKARADLVVVVPFHNEERYLPALMDSLRSQDADVPVVFVDNGSTDGSAGLVRSCDEVAAGRWLCISEERVGKFHAMQGGTAFATERFAARYVAFLDADSWCADRRWISTAAEIVERSNGRLGYITSLFCYVGMEHLPTFAVAYRAYERVLWELVDGIGWLANGQAWVCPVHVLERYFQRAAPTTEIDLRLSLLALSEGLEAELNPAPIVTSARRIVVNRRNFAAWCFYEREFYSGKDINAVEKIDLNVLGPVDDLQPDMVAEFFSRRALKLTCRHLVPFLRFSRGPALARVEAMLGSEIRERVAEMLEDLEWNVGDLLSERFEDVIKRIERHPVTLLLARRLAERMLEHHERNGVEAARVASPGTTSTSSARLPA